MLDTAIGFALYLTAIIFVLHGIRARRRKRLDTEPMSPMAFAAGEIMRPILQAVAVYAAVKTTLMYEVLGGSRIFPLADYLGVPVLLAAYCVWLQLKMKPLQPPRETDIAETAEPPSRTGPALPPELIPQHGPATVDQRERTLGTVE